MVVLQYYDAAILTRIFPEQKKKAKFKKITTRTSPMDIKNLG
jgi:hypothetical protein